MICSTILLVLLRKPNGSHLTPLIPLIIHLGALNMSWQYEPYDNLRSSIFQQAPHCWARTSDANVCDSMGSKKEPIVMHISYWIDLTIYKLRHSMVPNNSPTPGPTNLLHYRDRWHVDWGQVNANNNGNLWPSDGIPLTELRWDPGGLYWKDP